MSEVGPTGLFQREWVVRRFQSELFPGWKIPTSISRVAQSGGEHKLKSTVLEVGLGFGTGSLIIALLANDPLVGLGLPDTSCS